LIHVIHSGRGLILLQKALYSAGIKHVDTAVGNDDEKDTSYKPTYILARYLSEELKEVSISTCYPFGMAEIVEKTNSSIHCRSSQSVVSNTKYIRTMQHRTKEFRDAATVVLLSSYSDR
jgi:hypothetical protein